jgi:hypothetical protein
VLDLVLDERVGFGLILWRVRRGVSLEHQQRLCHEFRLISFDGLDV